MKIKLRDLTQLKFEKWKDSHCNKNKTCRRCPFRGAECLNHKDNWINHKNIFTDEFLDQEVEIKE